MEPHSALTPSRPPPPTASLSHAHELLQRVTASSAAAQARTPAHPPARGASLGGEGASPLPAASRPPDAQRRDSWTYTATASGDYTPNRTTAGAAHAHAHAAGRALYGLGPGHPSALPPAAAAAPSVPVSSLAAWRPTVTPTHSAGAAAAVYGLHAPPSSAPPAASTRTMAPLYTPASDSHHRTPSSHSLSSSLHPFVPPPPRSAHAALSAVPFASPTHRSFSGAMYATPLPSPAASARAPLFLSPPSAQGTPVLGFCVEHAMHLPLLPAAPVPSSAPRSKPGGEGRLALPNTYVTFDLQLGGVEQPMLSHTLMPAAPSATRFNESSLLAAPIALSGSTPLCLQSVCPRWQHTAVIQLAHLLSAGSSSLAAVPDEAYISCLALSSFRVGLWHRPAPASTAPSSPYRHFGTPGPAAVAAPAQQQEGDQLLGCTVVPLAGLLQLAVASSSSSTSLSLQGWYALRSSASLDAHRAPLQLSVSLTANSALRAVLQRYAHVQRANAAALVSPYLGYQLGSIGSQGGALVELLARQEAIHSTLRRAEELQLGQWASPGASMEQIHMRNTPLSPEQQLEQRLAMMQAGGMAPLPTSLPAARPSAHAPLSPHQFSSTPISQRLYEAAPSASRSVRHTPAYASAAMDHPFPVHSVYERDTSHSPAHAAHASRISPPRSTLPYDSIPPPMPSDDTDSIARHYSEDPSLMPVELSDVEVEEEEGNSERESDAEEEERRRQRDRAEQRNRMAATQQLARSQPPLSYSSPPLSAAPSAHTAAPPSTAAVPRVHSSLFGGVERACNFDDLRRDIAELERVQEALQRKFEEGVGVGGANPDQLPAPAAMPSPAVPELEDHIRALTAALEKAKAMAAAQTVAGGRATPIQAVSSAPASAAIPPTVLRRPQADISSASRAPTSARVHSRARSIDFASSSHSTPAPLAATTSPRLSSSSHPTRPATLPPARRRSLNHRSRRWSVKAEEEEESPFEPLPTHTLLITPASPAVHPAAAAAAVAHLPQQRANAAHVTPIPEKTTVEPTTDASAHKRVSSPAASTADATPAPPIVSAPSPADLDVEHPPSDPAADSSPALLSPTGLSRTLKRIVARGILDAAKRQRGAHPPTAAAAAAASSSDEHALYHHQQYLQQPVPQGVAAVRMQKERSKMGWPTLDQLLAASRAQKAALALEAGEGEGQAAASSEATEGTSKRRPSEGKHASPEKHAAQQQQEQQPPRSEKKNATGPRLQNESPVPSAIPTHRSSLPPPAVTTSATLPPSSSSSPSPAVSSPFLVAGPGHHLSPEAHEAERATVARIQQFTAWQARKQKERGMHPAGGAGGYPPSQSAPPPRTVETRNTPDESLYLPTLSPSSMPVVYAKPVALPYAHAFRASKSSSSSSGDDVSSTSDVADPLATSEDAYMTSNPPTAEPSPTAIIVGASPKGLHPPTEGPSAEEEEAGATEEAEEEEEEQVDQNETEDADEDVDDATRFSSPLLQSMSATPRQGAPTPTSLGMNLSPLDAHASDSELLMLRAGDRAAAATPSRSKWSQHSRGPSTLRSAAGELGSSMRRMGSRRDDDDSTDITDTEVDTEAEVEATPPSAHRLIFNPRYPERAVSGGSGGSRTPLDLNSSVPPSSDTEADLEDAVYDSEVQEDPHARSPSSFKFSRRLIPNHRHDEPMLGFGFGFGGAGPGVVNRARGSGRLLTVPLSYDPATGTVSHPLTPVTEEERGPSSSPQAPSSRSGKPEPLVLGPPVVEGLHHISVPDKQQDATRMSRSASPHRPPPHTSPSSSSPQSASSAPLLCPPEHGQGVLSSSPFAAARPHVPLTVADTVQSPVSPTEKLRQKRAEEARRQERLNRPSDPEVVAAVIDSVINPHSTHSPALSATSHGSLNVPSPRLQSRSASPTVMRSAAGGVPFLPPSPRLNAASEFPSPLPPVVTDSLCSPCARVLTPSTAPITAADLVELQEAVASLESARKKAEAAQAEEWTRAFESKWMERQKRKAAASARKKHHQGQGGGGGGHHGVSLSSQAKLMSRSLSQPMPLMTLQDPHSMITEREFELMSPDPVASARGHHGGGAFTFPSTVGNGKVLSPRSTIKVGQEPSSLNRMYGNTSQQMNGSGSGTVLAVLHEHAPSAHDALDLPPATNGALSVSPSLSARTTSFRAGRRRTNPGMGGGGNSNFSPPHIPGTLPQPGSHHLFSPLPPSVHERKASDGGGGGGSGGGILSAEAHLPPAPPDTHAADSIGQHSSNSSVAATEAPQSHSWSNPAESAGVTATTGEGSPMSVVRPEQDGVPTSTVSVAAAEEQPSDPDPNAARHLPERECLYVGNSRSCTPDPPTHPAFKDGQQTATGDGDAAATPATEDSTASKNSQASSSPNSHFPLLPTPPANAAQHNSPVSTNVDASKSL